MNNYDTSMLEEHGAVVEHGTSRPERWLRSRRVRIALWVAVIEGLFVALKVIAWPVALILAVGIIGIYFYAGHRLRAGVAREVGWIAAVARAAADSNGIIERQTRRPTWQLIFCFHLRGGPSTRASSGVHTPTTPIPRGSSPILPRHTPRSSCGAATRPSTVMQRR